MRSRQIARRWSAGERLPYRKGAESGYAELGCVFQTDFSDQYGEETWVVSHYAKDKKIAFIRTGPHRTTRYEITLAANGEETSLRWYQEITAFSQKSIELVGSAAENEFLTMMRQLENLLRHYLETGVQLS